MDTYVGWRWFLPDTRIPLFITITFYCQFNIEMIGNKKEREGLQKRVSIEQMARRRPEVFTFEKHKFKQFDAENFW